MQSAISQFITTSNHRGCKLTLAVALTLHSLKVKNLTNILKTVPDLYLPSTTLYFWHFRHLPSPVHSFHQDTMLSQKLCIRSLIKRVFMAEKLHPKIIRYNVKHWLEWCKAHCCWTLEQKNVFSGVMNHASLSGSLMDKSGLGGCQKNAA